MGDKRKIQNRALYEKVHNTNEDMIDFSLKATREEFEDDKNNYCCCLISVTEMWFYFPLAIVCAVIVIITHI